MNKQVLFIFAPNYALALRYVSKHKIAPRRWQCVHREETLNGQSDGTNVLILFGDDHGDFDWNDDRMHVRHWMFDLEKRGRITTTYRRMNEPPEGMFAG